MKGVLQRVWVVMVVLSMILPAAASAEVVEKLDLLEAYNAARDYDATIRAARARHQGVREEVKMAEAGFKPTLKVAAMRGRNTTDISREEMEEDEERTYDTENYSISLTQPVLNFSTIADYRKARAMVAHSETVLEEEQSSLIIRTAEAYFNLLLGHDYLMYSRSKVKAAEKTYTQASRKLKNGFGRITDVAEAEAGLDIAKAEELKAENDLEYQFGELERIIGFRPVQVCSLVPSAMDISIPGSQSIQEWIDMALASSPLVQRGREEVRIARREREKSRAARYPVLNLNAARTYSQSENNYTIGNTYDTYSLNLQFSMPLYSGGYISSTVRQASAGIIEAEEGLKHTERKIRSEVTKYYNALVDAVGKIHAYEKAVGSARVAYEGARKAYENDHGTVVEIEKAKAKELYARYQLSNIRYEFILNRLVLQHIAGSLTSEGVKEINQWLRMPISG